jgi:hypothetical protein
MAAVQMQKSADAKRRAGGAIHAGERGPKQIKPQCKFLRRLWYPRRPEPGSFHIQKRGQQVHAPHANMGSRRGAGQAGCGTEITRVTVPAAPT